jgi:hypothetical protein
MQTGKDTNQKTANLGHDRPAPRALPFLLEVELELFVKLGFLAGSLCQPAQPCERTKVISPPGPLDSK